MTRSREKLHHPLCQGQIKFLFTWDRKHWKAAIFRRALSIQKGRPKATIRPVPYPRGNFRTPRFILYYDTSVKRSCVSCLHEKGWLWDAQNTEKQPFFAEKWADL